MNKMLFEVPTHFESERLTMRAYQPGDGKWFYAMSLKNREHLRQYEADNVASTITDEEAAEELVRELAAEWMYRNCFFISIFDKTTGEFVGQIYVGPVDWNLPEFQIGYFVDVDHEGHGYITEAARATLQGIFTQLNAHRVRLVCDETNLRSIRVAERCNMTREGYLRENKRQPDGTYRVSFICGLLKSEYQVG